MNQDFGYFRHRGTNFVFHLMGQPMPFAHAQFSMHDKVQVHIQTESHFSHQAFVQTDDPRDSLSDRSHLRFNTRMWRTVPEFENCGLEQFPAVTAVPHRSRPSHLLVPSQVLQATQWRCQ
jgi:hypothetical protein